MITDEIYAKFSKVKENLKPGQIIGSFGLTKKGVYLYFWEGKSPEIIEFESEEAERNYYDECHRVYKELWEKEV